MKITIRKSTFYILTGLTCGLLAVICLVPQAAAVTIFEDTFDLDPNLNGWAESTDDAVHSPTGAGQVIVHRPATSGVHVSVNITRTVSTVGFENIELQLVAFQEDNTTGGTPGFEKNDYLRIKYGLTDSLANADYDDLFTDAGNWEGIQEDPLPSSDGSHEWNETPTATPVLALPPEAANNPDFQIKLVSRVNVLGEDYFYDNFILTGTPIAQSGTLDLEVDRTSGEFTLVNNSGSSLDIIGYSITSDEGAINPSAWTSIAENYDADSNNGSNTVDPNDNWVELSNPSSQTDLSEFTPGQLTGDGTTLANGQEVNLGPVWIKNLLENEDINATILVDDGSEDGELIPMNVSFVPGTETLDQFVAGDLDYDGDIDADDFLNVFVPNFLDSTSGLTSAEVYQKGDFNADGVVNKFDFLILNEQFLLTNPGAAALSFSATQVPEPTGFVLLAMGAIVATTLRRKQKGAIAITAVLTLFLMLGKSTTARADLVGWWNLADGSSSTATDSSASGNDGALMNFGVSPAWDTNLAGATISMPHGLYFAGGANDTGQPGVSVSNYINLDAHVNDYNTLGSGTVSGWFRRDVGATPDDHTIFSLGGDPGENSNFRMHIDNANGENSVYQVASQDENLLNQMQFASVDDGDWHHLAFTSDGTVSKAYLDGSLVKVDDLPFLDLKSWQRMAIGVLPRDDDFRSYFAGTLGDIRIYDEVLNQGEINYISDESNYGDGLAIEDYPMVVEVNTTSGAIQLVNKTDDAIAIDYYGIASEMNSLNPTGWGTLNSQDPGKWTKLANESFDLSESAFGEQTVILANSSIPLGNAYNTTINAADLLFDFHIAGVPLDSVAPFAEGGVVYVTSNSPLEGDFNADGIVNIADYTVWRDNLGAPTEAALNGNGSNGGGVDAADYTLWKTNFGTTSGALAGIVTNVPEPRSIMLLAMAFASVFVMRFGNRLSLVPARLAALLLFVCFASSASAVVTLDGEYEFGDSSDEMNFQTVVDGEVITATFESNSSGPKDLDLASGDPLYADLTKLPYSTGKPVAAGEWGADFDGDGDSIQRSITTHLTSLDTADTGISMWVYPRGSANRQALYFNEVNEVGVTITASGKWTQIVGPHDNDTDIVASVDVVKDSWTHIMQHTYSTDSPGAPSVRPSSGSGGDFITVLYINGEAVSAHIDNNSPLVGGALLMGAENPAAIENSFNGVIGHADLYNTFDFSLFEDNPSIVSQIASISSGVITDGNITAGDVNIDGVVDNDDVTAFVTGWLSENRIDGVNGDLYVGDLSTWQQGDMNLDGLVDLKDAFMLHKGLAPLGGFDFSLLTTGNTAVPEPSALMLLSLVGTAYLLRQRR